MCCHVSPVDSVDGTDFLLKDNVRRAVFGVVELKPSKPMQATWIECRRSQICVTILGSICSGLRIVPTYLADLS